MENDGKEDASSALSDYSSCDESEFDRYSSANSFLGTSSLCSSMGNHSEHTDFLRSVAGRDGLDCNDGREKFLKGSSMTDNRANWNRVYCSHNGMIDYHRENRPKEKEEQEASWRSRIRTWSASFLDSNENFGKHMNSGKVGQGKKEVVPLSTMRLSAQENVSASPDREMSCERFSKERQVIACEGTHSSRGKMSYCPQVTSCGGYSYSSLSGEAADWGMFDGEDPTIDCCMDNEDSSSGPGNDSLMNHADRKGLQLMCNKNIAGLQLQGNPVGLLVGESKLASIPLMNNTALGFSLSKVCQANDAEVTSDHDLTKLGKKNSHASEIQNLDADECLDELFFDMTEGISHDSLKSHVHKYRQGNHGYKLEHSHNIRDGSSTASSSLAHKVYPLVQYPVKIDLIQVVGSKQKTGEVSFGERLIGVKNYTVYKIQVQSGKDQWEVERRYRDFLSLYGQLNTLFTSHDLSLPSPWSKVEESRKYFGNTSHNVISKRTILIQDCLSTLLSCSTPFGIPCSLYWFLSPSKDLCKSNSLNILVPESFQRLKDEVNLNYSYGDDTSTLNKALALVVDMVPEKPIKQLLEKQHYKCAGCETSLDAEKTLMQDFIWMLGWGKPHLCEYTGQIFCASCHTGDTSSLPAKVLHQWDFSPRPVSRLAKAYLESIHDKPVLCLRAVNPSLFAKVQALHHVNSIRKKIESTLRFVRCSFRCSLERGLGSHRYLLENNDFFAPRDLIDISKGAFAGLPAAVETVLNKILGHIMQQCQTCYYMGIPCAAWESCRARSPLIFPFEEAHGILCMPCGFIFHEICIEYLDGCPCGKRVTQHLKPSVAEAPGCGADIELDGFVDSSIQKPNKKSPPEYMSELLSMARPEKLWKTWNRRPILLMDF